MTDSTEFGSLSDPAKVALRDAQKSGKPIQLFTFNGWVDSPDGNQFWSDRTYRVHPASMVDAPEAQAARIAELERAVEDAFWLGRSCGGAKADIDRALSKVRALQKEQRQG